MRPTICLFLALSLAWIPILTLGQPVPAFAETITHPIISADEMNKRDAARFELEQSDRAERKAEKAEKEAPKTQCTYSGIPGQWTNGGTHYSYSGIPGQWTSSGSKR